MHFSIPIPGATTSTSLTWGGGGDLVAVGGKVALLPIPLGTADFLARKLHISGKDFKFNPFFSLSTRTNPLTRLLVFKVIRVSTPMILLFRTIIEADPWSSAGTCGFRGTRRGTPFAAQTAAGNAICTVVDQGMQRAEVMRQRSFRFH